MKVLLAVLATALLACGDANINPRFEVRKRSQEENLVAHGDAPSAPTSMMVALNTGAKVEHGKKNDGVEKIYEAITGYLKKKDTPLFRAREEYNIKNHWNLNWNVDSSEVRPNDLESLKKRFNDDNYELKDYEEMYYDKPEVVKLGKGESSVKMELTADSIMKAVKDLLTSPKVQTVTDLVARKAAVLYRTVKEELAKEKKKNEKKKNEKSKKVKMNNKNRMSDSEKNSETEKNEMNEQDEINEDSEK